MTHESANESTRRDFVAGCAAAAAAAMASGVVVAGASKEDELDGFDALGLAELVRRRRVTPLELLENALTKIAAINPQINAVPVLHEAEARQQIAAGFDRDAPFAGVPFLLKDLWVGLAGTVTTNGSRFFADFRYGEDTEIVRRFKRAGLVIVGKTATPELGLSPTTESALHGATRNPWNLQRIAGGSSGGAAAAVAARIVPMAHATDGGGSIRTPASCCALFGMKPTRARTPMGPGKFEGWSGLSVGHAVTISVRDSAALLDAIAGPELGTPYVAPAHGSFLAAVRSRPKRLRIALMRRPIPGTEVDAVCLAALDHAAKLCESLGHEVVERAPAIDAAVMGSAFGTAVAVAIRQTLEDRGRTLGRMCKPEDVEPVTWMVAQSAKAIDGVALARAREDFAKIGHAMAQFQQTYDVVLSPTQAQPPVELGKLTLSPQSFENFARDVTRFSPFTSLANVTGQPAMSVPLYWTAQGLPVGVMFAGRYGEEELLFRLAAQLEEAAPWKDRRPPISAG